MFRYLVKPRTEESVGDYFERVAQYLKTMKNNAQECPNCKELRINCICDTLIKLKEKQNFEEWKSTMFSI